MLQDEQPEVVAKETPGYAEKMVRILANIEFCVCFVVHIFFFAMRENELINSNWLAGCFCLICLESCCTYHVHMSDIKKLSVS